MTKSNAINTVSDGLIMDIDPLQMSNSALTNCLNGTLLTFNGSENVLLNDMGNARVETAMLPTGYVPLGTASFGGIIYIVSLNPLTKEYQIGSFPSPERNLFKDELKDSTVTFIDLDGFCNEAGWNPVINGVESPLGYSPNTVLTSYYLKTNLTQFKIYPGDKYKVFSKDIPDALNIISAWPSVSSKDNPKYIKFDIITTLDSGETINLTDYSTRSAPESNGIPYYIYADDITADSTGKIDLDEYRDLVSSNYDVYQHKTSGKLGLAATLEVPTSFSVGYDVLVNSKEILRDKESLAWDVQFYLYLNWTNNNRGSANNPDRVNVLIEVETEKRTATIDTGNFDILLYAGKNEEGEDILIRPNNIFTTNYFTTVPPDNYLTSEWTTLYLDNGVNKFGDTLRKNDGTDFQYLLKGPKIKYYPDTKIFNYCDSDSYFECQECTGIINLKVTPIMPFGKLQFLELGININLNNIYSGEIYLNSYQYQVNNSDVNMDFNIEAYPEKGLSFDDLTIELYPLIGQGKWLLLKTYDSEDLFPELAELENKVKTIPLVGNANGTHHITFDRNNLEKDTIYIVKFIINYSKVIDGYPNTLRIFYRLFFNSTIFNASYGSEYDFKDLKLYGSNLKGGIKPVFKFDQDIINTSKNIKEIDNKVIPNEDNFPLYKENISDAEKITHLYEINHEINSTYKIDSGFGDKLKLNIQDITFNNAYAEYLSECTLRDTNYTQTVSNENSVLKLSNKFTLEALYNVDYSDSEELDIYNLEPLIKGNAEVRLSHWSKNTELGHFDMYVNDQWKIDNNYEYRFQVPDKTKGLVCYSDAYETRLLRILDEELCDYLTVVFGVEEMQDNDAGYSYDDSDKLIYYKFNLHKCHYLLVNVMRKSDGNIAIIHTSDIDLPDNVVDNEDDYILDISNWNKDYHKIALKYAKNSQVIKDTYKKYIKSGQSKTLFYIRSINSDELSVDTTYTINANININEIIISSASVTFDVDQIKDRENLANNLKVDNIENIQITIPLTNTINNKDLLYKATHRDSLASGWYNGSIIKQEDLYKVFDGNIPLTTMGLRENDRLLYYNDTKLNKVKWTFGWEETSGNKGTYITVDDFNTCKLSYDFRCTYKSRE